MGREKLGLPAGSQPNFLNKRLTKKKKKRMRDSENRRAQSNREQARAESTRCNSVARKYMQGRAFEVN